jgi:hypothetical protein
MYGALAAAALYVFEVFTELLESLGHVIISDVKQYLGPFTTGAVCANVFELALDLAFKALHVDPAVGAQLSSHSFCIFDSNE